MLSAVQREHLGAFFARDHHRIHLAGADGAKRFLGVGQAGAKFGELAGWREARDTLTAGDFQSGVLT
jgi:hypothetical protein